MSEDKQPASPEQSVSKPAQAPIQNQAAPNGQASAPKPADPKQEQAKEQAKELKDSQKKLFNVGEKKEEPAPPSFTQIDPATLPPEMKSIHDSMLADYNRKVSELNSQKGHVTEQDKGKILNDTLDNLTDQQFETATQHPMFVNRLMNYLNRQGYNNGQQQAQPQDNGGLTEQDLELADPLTRKLYEQNQELVQTIKELKGRVDNTDVASRNAQIQAEDARLQSKYQGLYNPNAINQFLGDVQNGTANLSRELIFKALDYDNAVRRWYDWGKEESYEENPNKGQSSMLSGIQSGGERAGYEAVKPEKGENRLSYFQRLFDNAKQKVANGERSPFQRNA